MKIARIAVVGMLALFFALPSKGQVPSQFDPKHFDPTVVDKYFAEAKETVGCDDSTWEMIHVVTRTILSAKSLPDSSEEFDKRQVQQILSCLDTISKQQDKMLKDLFAIVRFGRTNDAMSSMYLGWFIDLVMAGQYAQGAIHEYMEYKEETRYKALVREYNELARNVRTQTALRPAELHCVSTYDEYLKQTRLDCH